MESEILYDVFKHKQTDSRPKMYHQYRRPNFLNTSYDKNDYLHSAYNPKSSIN